MNDKFTVNCFICGESFSPDPIRVKLWAESGRPFDPTDWECPACAKAQSNYIDDLNDDDPCTWPCNADPANEADQQPMYICDYCQTELTYLEGDYLTCLNCSAQYTLVYDPETQTYEARLTDAYEIWLTNYLQQHRIVADLEKRLEDERKILDNLTFARPEPPSSDKPKIVDFIEDDPELFAKSRDIHNVDQLLDFLGLVIQAES